MDTDEIVKEIHKEVKEIGVKVHDMKAEQLVLTHVIREHERRSILLEKRQDVLGEKLEERLKPIQAHVDFVSIVLKGLGALAIAAATKIIADFLHLL